MVRTRKQQPVNCVESPTEPSPSSCKNIAPRSRSVLMVGCQCPIDHDSNEISNAILNPRRVTTNPAPSALDMFHYCQDVIALPGHYGSSVTRMIISHSPRQWQPTDGAWYLVVKNVGGVLKVGVRKNWNGDQDEVNGIKVGSVDERGRGYG